MLKDDNLTKMSAESLRIADKFSIETFGKSAESAYLKTIEQGRKEPLLDKLADKLYNSIGSIKGYFLG